MDIALGSDGASLFALIDDDLFHTVKAVAKDKCIDVCDLAKSLGVNRTYFYHMFKDKRIRVEHLIQLQAILELDLINQGHINQGINMITAFARQRYVLH
jgi:hypothetical protein